MNLTDARESLRVYLDDPRGDIYTDDKTILLLNQAIKRIYTKLLGIGYLYNPQTETVEFTSNTQEVALATTQRINRLWTARWNNGQDELPIYSEKMSKLSETPSVYFNGGGKSVGYYRVPGSTFKIDISFATEPELFIDGDTDVTKVLPEDYWNVIILQACVYGAISDEDNLQGLMLLRDSEMEDMTNELISDPTHVVDISHDYN